MNCAFAESGVNNVIQAELVLTGSIVFHRSHVTFRTSRVLFCFVFEKKVLSFGVVYVVTKRVLC